MADTGEVAKESLDLAAFVLITPGIVSLKLWRYLRNLSIAPLLWLLKLFRSYIESEKSFLFV